MEKIKMEKNRSFSLIFRYTKNVAFKIYVVNDSWLLPGRFGHLNFQSLINLQQNNMVYELLNIHEVKQVCEGCALGKHHWELFPKEKACLTSR